MPISQDFDYIKPTSVKEVVDLLDTYGKQSKILAGGTDLCNLLKLGFPVPKMMIDIKGIQELEQISLVDNTLHIGSLVTFTSILQSEIIKKNCNILWDASHVVASVGVRNRATMVGNICNAVACMDSAAPLLVHEAILHLISKNGERKIPVSNWFIDNRKTAIQEKEFITHVTIPLPKQKYAGSYQKLMRYSGEDLAQANIGILALEDNTYRVAFGAVGPIPKRSPKIEHFLHHKTLNDEVIAEAKAMIDTVIAPITDVRATKEYRMHMTKVLFERGIKEAFDRLHSI